jgi:hypothetical protein
MKDKAIETNSFGLVELSDQNEALPSGDIKENTSRDEQEMAYYGKAQQLKARFLYC